MSSPKFDAKIRFRIKGQEALPKWQREAIRKGMESQDGPPEALRFQCRIAMDAREVFERVELPDGSFLTFNDKKVRPQFGKNRDGQAYLTVTLTHSTTGDSYRVKWIGDAVPEAMQRTAVAHDKGLKVGAKVVLLDMAKAQITPSHVANGKAHRSARDNAAERKRRNELRAAGVAVSSRAPRHCARITDSDLISA
ncbi:hypothetical protein AB0300_15585 [Microbacterium sp. NPDC078814]|uniref:hypothetical protein n=1 Tax=Microbacterium sp. NPDC078814 TaxID=3154767 RepID=UPI00344F2D0B